MHSVDAVCASFKYRLLSCCGILCMQFLYYSWPTYQVAPGSCSYRTRRAELRLPVLASFLHVSIGYVAAPFSGNHARPDRSSRGASLAEERAVFAHGHSSEHLAAPASLRFAVLSLADGL